MIHHSRFVASKAISKDGWLEARREGVTATQVSRAASGPGGFEQAVQDYRTEFAEQITRTWRSVVSGSTY